jgi:hypothetical protein
MSLQTTEVIELEGELPVTAQEVPVYRNDPTKLRES